MPKDDMVRKLSQLAAGGKHPQNAERDLQNALTKFGLKLPVKIEHVPVRLYNPTTESIYESKMPIICPVSLASAIWREGPEFFKSVFLGEEGSAGAEAFWRNAKANSSWFKDASIPEESYPGLLPIFLYGDDVDAYRNSDHGAVSAIGWGCDFSYMRPALLQNFLLCCYSEYTACEFTHDDILTYVVGKFQQMSDWRLNHPWRAGGFRFYFCSVRGDLKWLNVSCMIPQHVFCFIFCFAICTEFSLQCPAYRVSITGA